MSRPKKESKEKSIVLSVRVIERETSEDFVKYIEKIRNDPKKNLSPIALEMMFEGYKSMLSNQADKILLPLPNRLSTKQKEWLKHDLSITFLSDVIGRIIEKVATGENKDITGMIQEMVFKKEPTVHVQDDDNDLTHFPSNSLNEKMLSTDVEMNQSEETSDDEIYMFASTFNNIYTKR